MIQPFQFKQFAIEQDQCAMRVGSDGILLGAWVDVSNTQKILDIGTGSGLIAIMLAQRTEEAQIHGIEIEEASFQQARTNMANSPWANRLLPIHQSIQNFAKTSNTKYDLIVSNPPFFSGGTFSLNENRKNVRHTVKLPHGDLMVAARKLLAPDGRFCIILPFIEGLRIQELAKKYRLYCTKITALKPRPNKSTERLLMQFEKKEATDIIRDELTMYADAKGDAYSDAYKALTAHFYLKG